MSEVTKDGISLRSYGYDSFGNRSKMVENGVETNYTFNSLNQLVSSTDGKSYDYDKRGNLTSISMHGNMLNLYEFNPLNRLEKAINHETGLSSVYKYNGLNKRVGNTIGDLDLNPTKHVEEVLDLTRSSHNLLERREDGKSTSFTYDLGLLSADGENYLLDDLGSPMRFGDELYVFDEFGNGLNANPSAFGFTGYSWDSTANSYFAQARQYDPSTGRFTSKDTHWHTRNMIYGDNRSIGSVPDVDAIIQSTNLYGYCGNNPIMRIDLSGDKYIIAWSYANIYLEDFMVNGVVDWNAFHAQNSFARAAYSERQRLIDNGVCESLIVVRRIDCADDLETAWSEWMEFDQVHQLHVFSHGTGDGPIMAGGGGADFLLNAPALPFQNSYYPEYYRYGFFWRNRGRRYRSENPFIAIYGCNTATGEWAQLFANGQNIGVYAQEFYASFSHNSRWFQGITHHDTSLDIYLRAFDNWTRVTGLFDRRTGLSNSSGRGQFFEPEECNDD